MHDRAYQRGSNVEREGDATCGCLLCREQLGAISGIINLCVQGQGGDIVMRILRYSLRKAILSSAQADVQRGTFC